MNPIDLPLRETLSCLPLFQGLGAAALDRVVSGVNDVHARGRSMLYKRGDACRCLYVVVAGQVKLSLEAPQGGEQIVEVVGPGGILGETALILGDTHVLSAETLEDSRLLCLPKAAVLAELGRTPEFARGLVTILSRRLQHLIGALENCTLRSGTERVIGYLLNHLPPATVNGQARITLPAKKGVIASQLNLTHEHFSRILRALATAAMIEVDGRIVHIPDVGKLRASGMGA